MKFNQLTDSFTLSNGYQIPCVGFGTWRTPDGETAVMCVKEALKVGYRHIDAAAIYGNEVGVGEGMKQGLAEAGIKREDIFVTSKLWNAERGYETTLRAFDKTLEDLQLDYLDLYLIHWPASQNSYGDGWQDLNLATWRAFEKLYEDGKIKAIGLSNFLVPYLTPILQEAKVLPMVNQIEIHPGYLQPETVALSLENNMLIEAWSPLGSGAVLTDPTLVAIAQKYGKSAAQVCVRWVLQHGFLPLVKSVTPARILENTKVFDFELTKEDMDMIDAMPETGFSGLRPDLNKF